MDVDTGTDVDAGTNGMDAGTDVDAGIDANAEMYTFGRFLFFQLLFQVFSSTDVPALLFSAS